MKHEIKFQFNSVGEAVMFMVHEAKRRGLRPSTLVIGGQNAYRLDCECRTQALEYGADGEIPSGKLQTFMGLPIVYTEADMIELGYEDKTTWSSRP